MVWPTSAVAQARLSLAAALNKLSQMFAIAALREEQSHKDAIILRF